MTSEPRVLPLVLRIRERIDQVFARYVGPIAAELCGEEFDHWRAEGQVGPSALNRYISRLAKYVAAELPRRSFIDEASKCIQVSDGSKSGGKP